MRERYERRSFYVRVLEMGYEKPEQANSV